MQIYTPGGEMRALHNTLSFSPVLCSVHPMYVPNMALCTVHCITLLASLHCAPNIYNNKWQHCMLMPNLLLQTALLLALKILQLTIA